MKNLIFGLVTFIILTSASCDKMLLGERFYFIKVSNSSTKPIYFYDASIQMETQYPDTALPKVRPSLVKIKSLESFRIDSRTKWEDNIQKLPRDTLSIFIIDSEEYENKSWNEVKNNYLILKRYDLSLENLKALNWTVTYPPTTDMKKMKMFPSYP